MLHLAGREEDWTAYRRLAPLADGDTLDLIDRVALAEAAGDSAGIEAEIRKIVDAGPGEVMGGIASTAAWTRDLATSNRLAERAIRDGSTPNVRATGHLARGLVDVLGGRPQKMQQDLSAAASFGIDRIPYVGSIPLWSLMIRFTCAATPILDVPAEAVRQIRDVVGRQVIDGAVTDSRAAQLLPALRLYRLGVLSARLGEADSAVAIANHMMRLPVPDGLDTVVLGMAQGVRSRAAWARGDVDRALLLADSAARVQIPADVIRIWDRSMENYVRAELLYQAGRYDEALPLWRNALDVGAVGEHVYGAVAQLRQAQIYDKQGNVAAAVKHYARFVQLWQDAEPPLQPVVRDARHRLQALQSASG